MSVTCELCFHHCRLEEGQTGFCKARTCRNGAVVPLNYGKLTSLALDPIEKKPLGRFHPGSLILSAGSFGCNLRCPHPAPRRTKNDLGIPRCHSYSKNGFKGLCPKGVFWSPAAGTIPAYFLGAKKVGKEPPKGKLRFPLGILFPTGVPW